MCVKFQLFFPIISASVHLPRIGHDTPGFNWYGTERLIKKHLASKGIPTYMYPFLFLCKHWYLIIVIFEFPKWQ